MENNINNNDNEYTEFGIQVPFFKTKYKFAVKVQTRSPTPTGAMMGVSGSGAGAAGSRGDYEPTGRGRPRSTRSRSNSTASSIADSLRNLDIESRPRSRRPVTSNSNWEFHNFLPSPFRTSTPTSGYNSAVVSRSSSFSSKQRLTSADDSAYSEVYSTIDELSELVDPFDEDEAEAIPESDVIPAMIASVLTPPLPPKPETLRKKPLAATTSTKSEEIPPPLPPRMSACRPPARPPFPSSTLRRNLSQ